MYIAWNIRILRLGTLGFPYTLARLKKIAHVAAIPTKHNHIKCNENWISLMKKVMFAILPIGLCYYIA